jgi:2-phosphosulfolactate phosphatase
LEVYSDQADFDLRCEWGLAGLRAVQTSIDAIVVVDVLSFSTSVDIAVSRGAVVYPYGWKDDSARQFAAIKGALLAGRRSKDAFSLSPNSLLSISAGTAIVLPSPNGSALSFGISGIPTFTTCLRNAACVARYASNRGRRIAVIPAGERWPDGSIRPCVEDWIGAGAVLSHLSVTLSSTPSPEADAAIAVFLAAREGLSETLARCASGRELIEAGYVADVALAAQYDVSSAAPVIADGRFVDDASI